MMSVAIFFGLLVGYIQGFLAPISLKLVVILADYISEEFKIKNTKITSFILFLTTGVAVAVLHFIVGLSFKDHFAELGTLFGKYWSFGFCFGLVLLLVIGNSDKSKKSK